MAVHQLWRFPRGGDEELPRGEGETEAMECVISRLVADAAEEAEAAEVAAEIRRQHSHRVGQGQCSSVVAQRIAAPAPAVWRIVRRFDRPQGYKSFVKRCSVTSGDGRAVGSTRRVEVVSGLPAASSTERLEILDEHRHILSFRILGGQHRLRNYRSITTLHEFRRRRRSCSGGGNADADADAGVEGSGANFSDVVTFVVESYVVDVPDGNTVDETRLFVDTIVKCNLHSLASISERRSSPQPHLLNTRQILDSP